jgi:putative endonuclease
MWLVYIIYSKKVNKTYTGSTNNFKRRYFEHNSNIVYSTKNKGPWVPIYIEFYPDEKSARERERYLKSTSGRRYLKKEINYIINKWRRSSVG